MPRELAPSKLLKINEAYSLTLVLTVVAATKLWSRITVEVLDFLPAANFKGSGAPKFVSLFAAFLGIFYVKMNEKLCSLNSIETLSREFFLVANWSGDPISAAAPFWEPSKFLISNEIRRGRKDLLFTKLREFFGIGVSVFLIRVINDLDLHLNLAFSLSVERVRLGNFSLNWQELLWLLILLYISF